MSTTIRLGSLILAGLIIGFCVSCQPSRVEGGRAIGGVTPEEMYSDRGVVSLVEAVLADDGSRIHQLSTKGVDVDSLPEGGVPPLIWAVHFDRLSALKALLASGADACQPIPALYGDSAIVVAVRTNKLGQLKAFLSGGTDPNCPISDTTELSLLSMAVSSGTIEAVRELVEAGADVNAGEDTDSVVLRAQAFGRYDIALYLLKHGYHHSLKEVAISAQRRLVSARSEESRQAVISYLRAKGVEIPVKGPLDRGELDEASSD